MLGSIHVALRARNVSKCYDSTLAVRYQRGSVVTNGISAISRSSSGGPVNDKYSKPHITDEGIAVYQSDPNTASSGPGLTWGSVMWPSGSCLAKYLAWKVREVDSTDQIFPQIDSSTRILELGCGTGIVGLTCAKLGAKGVTLSDSESALWPVLRKSINANNIDNDRINVHNLDWRDPTTFLDPAKAENRFNLIVAADVLYAGMDGLFARTLASHLPSKEENDGQHPPDAIIACPFRKDSPLFNFFGIASRLGLSLDRLEDMNGNAAGAAQGTNASEAFRRSKFVPLGDEMDSLGGLSRWENVAKEPEFSSYNQDRIQIFRVCRVSGTSAEARAIRRVGRL